MHILLRSHLNSLIQFQFLDESLPVSCCLDGIPQSNLLALAHQNAHIPLSCEVNAEYGNPQWAFRPGVARLHSFSDVAAVVSQYVYPRAIARRLVVHHNSPNGVLPNPIIEIACSKYINHNRICKLGPALPASIHVGAAPNSFHILGVTTCA